MTKKMKSLGFFFMPILALCIWEQPSWATNAFVTDVLKITLRTGPSLENRVIATLSSGQAVEIMESEGDWSFVRVLSEEEEDMEGWLLTRYLTTRLPWELQAESLRRTSEQLEEQLTSLQQKYQEAALNHETASKELEKMTQAYSELQNEHENLKQEASHYLELRTKYESTKAELESARRMLETLESENEKLSSSQRNKWFLAGALVLLCGLVIGLVLGRQRKRKSLYY